VTPPEARSDLWRVEVDGQWLIFDPRRKRAHLLNTSAVTVLDLLDGHRGIDDVVERCAATTGVSPDVLRSDVVDAIDGLTAEGLVVTDVSIIEDTPPELPLTTDEPVVTGEAPQRTSRFRGIETTFDVATDDPALTARLDHLLSALSVPDTGAESPNDDRVVHHYTITTDSSTTTIALDGLVVVRLPAGPLVLQYLLWHIDRLVVATTTRHLLLHAGAVIADDGVTVLAGVMNSGKSTLTAALVRDGLGFITDEMVALDVGDQLVTPFPRPITLEFGSWPLFEATADDGAHASNGTRRYLDPDETADETGDETAAGTGESERRPITHLVFPQFVAGTEIELTPVAPADAALELARHTFTLDEDGMTALAALAVRVPAIRLRHPGIDVAVPALRGWLA